MLTKDCEGCKYRLWMVGIGQGVRCSNEENQKYKEKESNMPIIISYVPENCSFYKKHSTLD